MLESVQRGIQVLDQQYPDWASEIDIESLEFNSHTQDILGQLYGTYAKGFQALAHHTNTSVSDWATYHGFWNPDSKKLKQLWTTYLRNR